MLDALCSGKVWLDWVSEPAREDAVLEQDANVSNQYIDLDVHVRRQESGTGMQFTAVLARAYKQTRSCPGRVGVETVSPGVDRVGLFCSTLLRYALPSHHGGELCSGLKASQTCGLQADSMAVLFIETMAMTEGLPAQSVRVKGLGMFLISNRGAGRY